VHLREDANGRAAFVRSTELGPVVFVNPVHPEVQAYELAVLWEVVSRYPVDGIVLDRTRYAGLDADYSELSRARFEAFIGRPVTRWPEDVVVPGGDGLAHGPLFREWAAWRASVIRGFVRSAGRLVRHLRPGLPVAMYVGGWYSTMLELGQNWSRPDVRLPFASWSPALSEASLLPELDYLMVGLYYRMVTRMEALRHGRTVLATVIGVGILSRELTLGTPLVAGVWLDLYQRNPRAGEGAIRAAVRLADGAMFFDLSNVQPGGWWNALGIR
jgi:hypothetical protein